MNLNQSSSNPTWPQPFDEEPVAAAPADDEFANFLHLDTEFAGFEGLDNGPSGLDTPMGRLGFDQFNLDHQDQMNLDMSAMPTTSTMNRSDMHQSAGMMATAHQSFYPDLSQSQMMPPHGYQVPLTPVSGEMPGAKYGGQVDGNGNVVYNRPMMSFTPLVSPAQTPLDGYGMPEYGSANDFFSPLTSPAIEAQHVLGSNGTSSSPVDLGAGDSSTNGEEQPPAKRTRRKPAAAPRTTTRSVKQSPAMKPQNRRRPASLSTLPSDLVSAVSQIHSNQAHVKGAASSTQPPSSSGSSLSPEPLSEALMPPPAMPRSAGKSPATPASVKAGESSGPVTPAILMRIPSKQQSQSAPGSDLVAQERHPMEDIRLPDSAIPAPSPVISPVDASQHGGPRDATTPKVPIASSTMSGSSTPRQATVTPQILSQADSTLRRSESRMGQRNNKKRPGTASAAISPALRPKISPSITPLVPAAGPGMPMLSAETSALYLASKSNYQNILEGTHLPGVSYPEALAENLSSKRTSHKIAEQGRRNRINTALKEIEALLPASVLASSKKERAASTEETEGDKGAAAGGGASKASTVEMACLYIRNLQAELKVARDKLGEAEKKLAERPSGSSQGSE